MRSCRKSRERSESSGNRQREFSARNNNKTENDYDYVQNSDRGSAGVDDRGNLCKRAVTELGGPGPGFFSGAIPGPGCPEWRRADTCRQNGPGAAWRRGSCRIRVRQAAHFAAPLHWDLDAHFAFINIGRCSDSCRAADQAFAARRRMSTAAVVPSAPQERPEKPDARAAADGRSALAAPLLSGLRGGRHWLLRRRAKQR